MKDFVGVTFFAAGAAVGILLGLTILGFMIAEVGWFPNKTQYWIANINSVLGIGFVTGCVFYVVGRLWLLFWPR